MTIERKVGMGIAGQPSGGATDVADVFSTYLYKGNATARAITNGIDLAGEGGMVWVKQRNGTGYHRVFDTERTGGKALFTNVTNAENSPTEISSFNSNGFSLTSGSDANINNYSLASWTFRKKEKFFSVITWSGNNTGVRVIPHDLNSDVGFLIIRKLSGSEWFCKHKSLASNKVIDIDSYYGSYNGGQFNSTDPTSTGFTVEAGFNTTGRTYVAYLFADNSSEDAEDQMIKCGSYTGNGGTQQISLGWEPQFVMIKKTSGTGDWHIIDNMRTGYLEANTATAEQGALFTVGETISPNADGFYLEDGSALSNANGAAYIYMAIRAPMMVKPKAATDVYASNIWAGNGANGRSFTGLGLTPDVNITVGRASAPHCLSARILPVGMFTTHNTDAQYSSLSGWMKYDINDGFTIPTSYSYSNASGSNYIAHNFKRAKGFMDVVCDTRAFTYGTLNHSLGVVPELIIKKDRSRANNWDVLPNVSPYDYRYNIYLNDTQAISGPSSAYWNSAPTNTSFGVHYGNDGSSNGDNFVFYLFATLAGISKVGSYTGNGSNQTINCGFSAGSRFILIKRTDAAGDWYIWDSTRGIVAGNDPHLSLNTTAAEVTSNDSVDPANAGFIVNQVSATNINVSSGTYIFYAIA